MTLQFFRTTRGIRPTMRRVAYVLVLVGCVGMCAGALAAEHPPAGRSPDALVPVTSQPQQDQLPAAPLLISAYIVVWLVLLAYLWTIWRRLSRVDRELADLQRRLSRREPQASRLVE